jgi:hypothetical protein
MVSRRKAAVGVRNEAWVCSGWLAPEQPNHSVTQGILGPSQLIESAVLVEMG